MSQALLPGVEPEIEPDRDAWTTPEWVWRIPLEAMGLSTYDLDPCTNELATVPATRKVMPPEDGLSVLDNLRLNRGAIERRRLVLWKNPPFSDVGPWFERVHALADCGVITWGVVPHSPNNEAWKRWGPDRAWSLGRVAFVPPPGAKESSPAQEHDLVLWRRTGLHRAEDFVSSHPRVLYSMRRKGER